MFDGVSRSDTHGSRLEAVPASVRGNSQITVAFAGSRRDAHIAQLFERGGLRLRYPRANGAREAVIVNTGGGITGGDLLAVSVDVASGAQVTVTSQAAEKLYRSDGARTSISTRLRVADGASLDWLPQETIIYDGAVAHRQLEIDLAGSARLVAFEATCLGRVAHGEELRQIEWRDRWRIRREGRLILAEDVRLDGDAASLMQRTASGCGARALGTLVYVAPDAEAKLDAVREAIGEADLPCGASAWNGMLVARLVASDLRFVRALGAAAICAITTRPMPRAWSC